MSELIGPLERALQRTLEILSTVFPEVRNGLSEISTEYIAPETMLLPGLRIFILNGHYEKVGYFSCREGYPIRWVGNRWMHKF